MKLSVTHTHKQTRARTQCGAFSQSLRFELPAVIRDESQMKVHNDDNNDAESADMMKGRKLALCVCFYKCGHSQQTG